MTNMMTLANFTAQMENNPFDVPSDFLLMVGGYESMEDAFDAFQTYCAANGINVTADTNIF